MDAVDPALVALASTPLTSTPLAAGADPGASPGGSGLAGFLVIFALALATVVLIRSMVGHLRKVRYGPGPPDAPGDPGSPDAENGAGRRDATGPDPKDAGPPAP